MEIVLRGSKAVRLYPLRLASGQLEVLKWIALAAMLLEHVQKFWLRDLPSLEPVGRLAFPLFAFALCFNLQRGNFSAVAPRVLSRLVLFGLLAQLGYAPLQSHLVGNVLFSMACGVAAFWAWRELSASAFVLAALVLAAVAWWCEFWLCGFALVLSLLFCFESPTRLRWLMVGLALGSVAALSMMPWALLVVPLVWIVSRVSVNFPRVPHVFYWVYVAQWPLLLVLDRYW